MCVPAALAAASLAIGAASAITQHNQQADMAKAQNKALLDDYNNQVAAQQEQAEEIHAQAADKMSERARAAKIERGRLKALAAESGLGYGNTAERIENESHFNEGQDIASIQGNYARSLKQNARETQGIYATTKGNINQIKRPSRLATGLKIGGSAVDAANDYQRYIGAQKGRS